MNPPDLWFLVATAGILLLCWEFFRPGMVAPAAGGLFCLLLSVYHLVLLSPSRSGLALIALAILLLLSEFLIETRYAGGIAGSAAFVAGALRLYNGSARIHLVVVVIAALSIGPPSRFLLVRARRARSNKHADL